MHAEAQSADLDTFLIPVLEQTFAYCICSETYSISGIMLNTEVLWNKALTGHDVRGITHWLQSLNTEGQADVDKNLAKFKCWLQCSIELTKKKLLSLCSGQCHGQWMFLDHTSLIKLCLLIQKLRNLLLLARWGQKCVICQINANTMAQCQCWTTLSQHILLGRLVQWCSVNGLLPQYPDASKLKQISQMWQEMNQQHKSTCLELRCDTEDEYKKSSIVQCMVAHMHKQYGPLWVSEDGTHPTYPPPSLNSLLNLVLVPYRDTTSALAIIIYFFLDVSNRQCKVDLLESFCHAFSIPSSFCKQIYGLWLLDHGFASLLSPGTSSAWLSCPIYDVLRTLLTQGRRQAALKYLYYTKPTIENTQDARLHLDVLLQNNCVAEAQILLRQCQPGMEYLLENFICGCKNANLCGEALASNIPHLKLLKSPNFTKPEEINQRNLSVKFVGNTFDGKGHAPRPFSALLYQCVFNGSLTPEDFLRLFRETVTNLNPPKHTRMMVVWPKYLDKTEGNRNTSLSPETFCHFSPHPVELQKDQSELLQNDRMKVCVAPAVVSSGSTSPSSMEPACSFISSSSPVPAERVQEDARVEGWGTSKAMLIKSSSKESVDELVTSDNGVEDDLSCTLPGNLVEPTESHILEVTQIEDGNKDNQSLLYSATLSPVVGDNFFINYFEKMTEDEVPEPHSENIRTDECEQFSVLSSESVYCQDSMCDEVSGSCSFLDLKPLRRALPCSPVKKSLRCLSLDFQDAMDQPEILTSCACTEDLQIHDQTFTLKAGEIEQSSSLASVRSSHLVMDFNPLRHGSHPQISLRASLLPLSSGSEGRNVGIKEVVCFRTTTDRVGDYKLGSWWKQALETRRASTGLLPAIEQIPAVTKEKRHSLVLGWPCGLIRELKQEIKQKNALSTWA